MITGDNPLTACHVARELKFLRCKQTLILKKLDDNTDEWVWQSVDESVTLTVDYSKTALRLLVQKYDLCITGEGLLYLSSEYKSYFERVLPHVRVYARVAPKQKELVITTLRSLGYVTLMCGDGTNDVGALKHANVGKSVSEDGAMYDAESSRPRPEQRICFRGRHTVAFTRTWQEEEDGGAERQREGKQA